MAIEQEVDLIIVGGGPAGLSAAVNAAYEGIETMVLDGKGRFGGQAGQALKIENYAGFPDGISGFDLTSRMLDQGDRLGADYRAPFRVESIEVNGNTFKVNDGDGSIIGKAVLAATGVEYRRHNASNLSVFLTRGVNYGTPPRGIVYEDKKLTVVGGANSAGQAAISLAKMPGCSVSLLVRGPDIGKKMSAKLVREIEEAPNIEVLVSTEITNAKGSNGHLSSLTVNREGVEVELFTEEVFLLIGATPRTKWLPLEVVRDRLGFICAGRQLDAEIRKQFEDGCGRPPMDRETSVPGIFVVGDARSSTIKRVATAAGDGANAIPEIYQLLHK